MWVDEDNAAKLVSRSKRTLRWWYQMRLVQRRRHNGRYQYETESLKAAKATQEYNYAQRTIVPGLGGRRGTRGWLKPPEGMDPLFEIDGGP